MPDPYGHAAAKEANDRYRRQQDTYRYTTEPLNKINDTLRDILSELRKITEKINSD
jgi:hypothetical protein